MNLFQPRMPWRLQRLLDALVPLGRFASNQWHHRAGRNAPRRGAPRVEFWIPQYGYTGGAAAVVATANLIARDYPTGFVTTPTSVLNRYLGHCVHMRRAPLAQADARIIESGASLEQIRQWRASGCRVIVTHHGFPRSNTVKHVNYGYEDSHIRQAIALASESHFISAAQARAFIEAGLESRPASVIPNAVAAVDKRARTRNAGIVCDTRLELKNARGAVRAAESSRAEAIHVWGRHAQTYGSERVRWHGFSTDKRRMLDSFDVLVLLSYTEVQPLSVLEALSAGIPCVLSDLGCYEEFRGCPGFWFVDPDDAAQGAQAIDEALDAPETVRRQLRDLWAARYSPDAVRKKWLELLAQRPATDPA